MGIEKDVRKLKAEELEKRLAPAIYVDPGEPSDPGPTGGGGGSEPPVDPPVEPPRTNPTGRDMGSSDGHRQDVVNEA